MSASIRWMGGPIALWIIHPPATLETLCNRPVSARPPPGVVDIRRPRPIRTLCISWVRTLAITAKPLPRGLARACRCFRDRGCRRRLASPRERCNAPARLGMRREPPTSLRQNSLNSAAKPAQSFSLRRRVSKMRKNFLAFPRKNRAIPLLAAGVVRRRGARPGTAQSTIRRHPP
ncbi:hypothetical protein KDW10_25750 [Burkholderia vietnamiensis]|uniref:hypothetical protein n=1 Tax=Burkholderia vietnamiensis TaxID=60552 RepID=UPI001B982E90|nr:hypothetical protein [Burkholderia vietnamiensis]MBR8360735.1 hypothetical protein [Burkholderia vietnamiensis]